MSIRYNKNYYDDIWHKILKRYSPSDEVVDLGDVSRSTTLDKLLKKFLIPSTKNRKNVIINDFGPGNWLYLNVLIGLQKNIFELKIVGLDYSKEAMSFGLNKYASLLKNNKNVKILTKPGNLNIQIKSIRSSSVDCVISMETLEHLPSDDVIFKEFYRILKKDGVLIISVPNNNSLFLSKDWFMYTFNSKKLIKKDKIVGHLRRYNHDSLLKLAKGLNMKLLNITGYGFLLSDYMKELISYSQKWKNISKRIFKICRTLLIFENNFFNGIDITKSEGFFVVLKKNG